MPWLYFLCWKLFGLKCLLNIMQRNRTDIRLINLIFAVFSSASWALIPYHIYIAGDGISLNKVLFWFEGLWDVKLSPQYCSKRDNVPLYQQAIVQVQTVLRCIPKYTKVSVIKIPVCKQLRKTSTSRFERPIFNPRDLSPWSVKSFKLLFTIAISAQTDWARLTWQYKDLYLLLLLLFLYLFFC